jgi:hypothetical protein
MASPKHKGAIRSLISALVERGHYAGDPIMSLGNDPFYFEAFEGEIDAIRARYKRKGRTIALETPIFREGEDVEDPTEPVEPE